MLGQGEDAVDSKVVRRHLDLQPASVQRAGCRTREDGVGGFLAGWVRDGRFGGRAGG